MFIANLAFNLVQHYWRTYYLATPLFILLDLFFGVSIRIPFMDHSPTLKYIFYVLLFVCGILIHYYPQSALSIGLFDCTVQIILVVLGFIMPLYQVPFSEEELVQLSQNYTFENIIHFGLTSSLLVFWFYRQKQKVEG